MNIGVTDFFTLRGVQRGLCGVKCVAENLVRLAEQAFTGVIFYIHS